MYGVYSRYRGPVASDREPERCAFGPASKEACERYVERRNWDKGIGDYMGGAPHFYVAEYRGDVVEP